MLAASGLLEFLQEWHNSVYVTPLLLGLFLLLFQFVGLVGGGHDADGDADHDVDADGDVDADHDVDADGDVDADHDVDADADHDVDGDHDADHDADHADVHGGALSGALKFLGAGRVPFVAVLQSLLLSVGAAGLIATYALGRSGTVAPGAPMLAASLPIALVAGLAFAKVLTSFLGRFAATIETKARRLGSLEGEIAVVESATVDVTQGRGTYHDQGGTEVTVFLRTPASAPAIAKGTRVRLDQFQPKDNTFLVSVAPATGAPPQAGPAPSPEPKKEASP